MFWTIFYDECQRQGTSPNAVCDAIGLSNSTATGWKKGTMPKGDVLAKIADYLNVSVDYLLGRDEKSAPNDDVRSAIIDKVSNMSDAQAEKLLALLESLISE